MTTVQKYHPTVQECKRNRSVRCTEKDCPSVFTSESKLTLHLVKTHHKSGLWQSDVIKEFYCPNLKCPYNKEKFFKNMKSLRQHFLKVHTSKEFNCQSCTKSFQSVELQKNHQEYCGASFKCCDCAAFYACYETLKTHARRKKHTILNKNMYKPSNQTKKESNTNVIRPIWSAYKLILPKPPANIINQSIQTENILIITQPQNVGKNVQQNVETQTLLNCSKTKPTTHTGEDNRKNIKTQTTKKSFKTQSCNTLFNFEKFDFIMTNEVEKNTSSTQTNDINLSDYATVTADSISTGTSDLLSTSLTEDNLNSFDDGNFFNCNMETQTDLMLHDDLFNYCSNDMYTQTCDDVLSGLGFNDIETQTALDDMLNSVEIQTTMSQSKRLDLSSQVFADIETQTDMGFEQMLEDINS